MLWMERANLPVPALLPCFKICERLHAFLCLPAPALLPKFPLFDSQRVMSSWEHRKASTQFWLTTVCPSFLPQFPAAAGPLARYQASTEWTEPGHETGYRSPTDPILQQSFAAQASIDVAQASISEWYRPWLMRFPKSTAKIVANPTGKIMTSAASALEPTTVRWSL